MHKLESGVEPIKSNMDEAVIIIDEMAMVQKSKSPVLAFGELAKQLFTTTLATGSESSRDDVVFDQFKKKFHKGSRT